MFINIKKKHEEKMGEERAEENGGSAENTRVQFKVLFH
jgi:hypothetical protein